MMPKGGRLGFEIMRAAGALFLLVVAAYGVHLLTARPFMRASPQVLGVGSGFEGSAQLPKEAIDAVIEAGRQQIAARNSIGNRFAVLGTASDWLTFLLSSLITLVAGYYGINSTATGGTTTAELLRARSRRFARIVGVTAAAAAVSTALAGRAAVAADGYYKRADELQRKITSARKEILEAKTAHEASIVLDQLKSEIR